jgi:hypothetical protein
MAMVQFNWFAGAADGHALRDWSRDVFTAIGTGIEAEGDKKSLVFFFDKSKVVQQYTISTSKVDVSRGLITR